MARAQVKLSPITKITHVGSMDPKHKGAQGDSLEGAGLSFSKHPEDWTKIARLGGGSWWEANLDGFNILDGHALIKKHEAGLGAWGIENGMVTSGKAYMVSWIDEDVGRVNMLMRNKKEALFEKDGRDDCKIKEIDTYLPTEKLLLLMRHKKSKAGKPSVQVMEDLATVWAEQNGLHGVWWNDVHDPDNLSCPRGVLFAPYVKAAKFEEVVVARKPKMR